jgi:hypothetical protein
MATPQLIQRLQISKARHDLILNAPSSYLDLLKDVPDFHFDKAPKGKYDFAQLFVVNQAELDQNIDQVLGALEYDAMFWICYPKGTSGIKTDINRDTIWKQMTAKGIRPVSNLAIDDTWSAIRMRPIELVKSKAGE